MYIFRLPATEEQISEVIELSGVLEHDDDFFSNKFQTECERIILFPEKVEPCECKYAFLYLKENFVFDD